MDYKNLIIESALRLGRSGLVHGNEGNLSAVDRETGLVYMTPTSTPYEQLTPENIAVCNFAGEQVGGILKATVEKELHLEIYRRRPDVKVMVHTHSPYASLCSIKNLTIPQITDPARILIGNDVKIADHAEPGSLLLGENCVKALGEGKACLLAKHGVVVVSAKGMDEAFNLAHLVEDTAQIYCLSLMMK